MTSSLGDELLKYLSPRDASSGYSRSGIKLPSHSNIPEELTRQSQTRKDKLFSYQRKLYSAAKLDDVIVYLETGRYLSRYSGDIFPVQFNNEFCSY